MIHTIVFVALWTGAVRGEYSAMCDIKSSTGSDIEHIYGMVLLEQDANGTVKIALDLKGFSTTDNNMEHGFHIHTDGDMSDACRGAGGHFNPHGADHGAIDASNRHVGDLGNIMETNGIVQTEIVDDSGLIQLDPNHEHTVIGRAIVVHERRDDLGLGSASGSMTTGDAGARMACCIIKEENNAARALTAHMSALCIIMSAAVFIKRAFL